MKNKNISIIIVIGVVLVAAVISIVSWVNMKKPTTGSYGEFAVVATFKRSVTEGDISPELTPGTYALFENKDESFLVDIKDLPPTSIQVDDLKSGTEYVITYQQKLTVQETIYKQLDWIISVKDTSMYLNFPISNE